jgi:AraC family transcriptional activator of mtrCDE
MSCSDATCTLPWLRALEDPDLRPALEAMLSAPHKPHTVASLAHACHMSRSTFARRFKVSFGRGPMEYLREVRLRKAAKLLRKKPPPSVVSIASQVGFDSRSQFSRAFRDYFAYSPSEFTGLAHVSGTWG